MKLALILIVILPVVTCFIRSSLSSSIARNGIYMSNSDTYALLFDCDGKYQFTIYRGQIIFSNNFLRI